MWFLPSYGRPGRCQETLDSIAAAMPTRGYVAIDAAQCDDYAGLVLPPGWRVIYRPVGLNLCQALNWLLAQYSDLPWYGLLADDLIVQTRDWSEPLISAAGMYGFANSADGWQAGGPTSGRMHGAVVFGGDLLRAFGWWAPPLIAHSYVEDCWERAGRGLGNWHHVPDVMVEHRHAWNGKAPNDATYHKNYSTYEQDTRLYAEISHAEIPAAIERARKMMLEKSRMVILNSAAELDPQEDVRTIWYDGEAIRCGNALAAVIGPNLPVGSWTRFAWKSIAEDFGLLDARSKPWPAPSQEEAADLIAWLQSPGKTTLYQHLAAALGGKIIQFSGDGIHVAMCTPVAAYRPDWEWVQSRDRTAAMCTQMGVTLSTHTVFGGSHVGKARENLLWDAMSSPATHILFVDDDMGWDPRTLARLLAADMDFVAAVGCKKQEKFGVCCNFLPNPQHFDQRTGFLEVHDVGFAFVLLKRSVIERMFGAHPELEYRTTNGRRESALFFDMIDDGDRLSEDYAFCRRWRKIGGRIFIDQDASLKHMGRKEYSGAPVQLLQPLAAQVFA